MVGIPDDLDSLAEEAKDGVCLCPSDAMRLIECIKELRAQFDSMVRLNDANLKCYDNCAKEIANRKGGYIYLASPYSHPLPAVRYQRFKLVCRIAGRLMQDGNVVFSPIAHTHPITELCDLPKGWDYWQKYDLAMILGSYKVIVCMMDGWRESKGVTAEIEIAHRYGIPVEYLVISGDQFTIKTSEGW